MTVGYCYYLIERRGVGGTNFPTSRTFSRRGLFSEGVLRFKVGWA